VQRASQRSAAKVPAGSSAGEGTAGPSDTGAAAAAAAAAAADDDDGGAAADGGAGADDPGDERSNSGRAPSRTKRKGASQAGLEQDYRKLKYYNNFKYLNDANRKKFDVVTDDLCQLTHRDTFCSHNALKQSPRVQIQLHQAQFGAIYMSAAGVLRCSFSPVWQESAEVQEHVEGLLQAIRQHWFDAEAGDTEVEPSLYEPQQRLPPTLGLHAMGSHLLATWR
jgi:hypothetical protein